MRMVREHPPPANGQHEAVPPSGLPFPLVQLSSRQIPRVSSKSKKHFGCVTPAFFGGIHADHQIFLFLKKEFFKPCGWSLAKYKKKPLKTYFTSIAGILQGSLNFAVVICGCSLDQQGAPKNCFFGGVTNIIKFSSTASPDVEIGQK